MAVRIQTETLLAPVIALKVVKSVSEVILNECTFRTTVESTGFPPNV